MPLKKIKRSLFLFQRLLMELFYIKPDIVISFGNSIGDDLLCTILARQLKTQGYRNIWIKTCYPEIFFNNPDIGRIIKKRNYANGSPVIEDFLERNHPRVINPWYTKYDSATDQNVIPQKHIVHIMCDIANVPYPKTIKPFFHLNDKEKRKGRLFDNQVCIQSTGKASKNYMSNKEWFPDRFERITSFLNKKYKVIQIGSKEDYLLPGAVDMRGKTSIRETSAILYNSLFFVGLVGFLMHLSRAVNCRSIIIYGGREKPDQTGYEFNTNLYSEISCSPCWYWNTCPYNKVCMDMITVETVVDAIVLTEARLNTLNDKKEEVGNGYSEYK